jgi:phospho-N-acetylmuramoyl-pentapeptide-transferase
LNPGDQITTWAVAFFAAFGAVIAVGSAAIRYLHRVKFGQNINADAPDRHATKQGTPTMGGILIVFGVLVGLAVVWLFKWSNLDTSSIPAESLDPLIAVLLVFLGHALLGFIDDYMSIKRGRSLGLKARYKMLGQAVIAGLFVLWLSIVSKSNGDITVILIAQRHIYLGVSYYILACLWIIGMSNATNFTDGLDGLLGGTAILATVALTLTIASIDRTITGQGLGWFGCALIGACLGFLWYNAHPAKVFMGDTGSLPIGAALAAMAIVSKHEILVLVFGVVFIIEMVSVMIQVTVFKATGGKPNGRRVFKMTPIHHHFELSGVPETTIVTRFWIVGVLALAVGLFLAWYEIL